MNNPIRINELDVVGAVPYLFGYVPSEQIVVVTLSNGGRTLNGYETEVDTPPFPAAAHFGRSLYGKTFDEAIIIVYSEKEPEEGHKYPYEELGNAVGTALAIFYGQTQTSMLCVTKGKIGSYADTNQLDYAEAEHSTLAAGLVLQGATYRKERFSVYVPPVPEDAAELKADLKEWDQAVAHAFGDERPEYEEGTERITAALELWEKVRSRDFGPTRSEALELIALFQHGNPRDVLMIAGVYEGHLCESHAVGVMAGALPFELDRSRPRRSAEVMANLLQYAPDDHRVALMIPLSFFYWYQGDVSTALAWLKEADRIEPGEVGVEMYGHLYQHVGSPSAVTTSKNEGK